MKQYLEILNKIMTSPYSVHKPTRTGTDTISLSGVQFEHDMTDGFPLLTTKKMSLKNIAVELEFFIKGYSDKKWLQDRGCHIWDEWCNPQKVPYGTDEYSQSEMAKCDDLGRIYGVQWRDWRYFETHESKNISGLDAPYYSVPMRYDQLQNLIDRAKKDPLDRRLIVTAWRPDELNQMALPPCHYAWQILSDGTYLDLIWIQRSVDAGLGLPYNIASYGLLLLLLAWELKLKPRRLVGQLADTHLYVNHIEQVKTQLSREPFSLPDVYMMQDDWNGILNWDHTKLKIIGYSHHPKIDMPISI